MTLKLLFIFLKDPGEEKDVYLKSQNITIITGTNTNGLIKSIFSYLLLESQSNLSIKMRGSGFIFDSVDKTFY